jgi:uncharacterized membrane protein
MALAAGGFCIAGYLACFQLGVVTSVWDPFFGDGSRTVLTSAISRALPVPDAALGALAYASDIVLELIGGEDRYRTMPWLVVAFGGLLAFYALTSVGLVIAQPLIAGGLCTLCLCSAAISIVIAVLARTEVAAAYRELRRTKPKEVAG